MSTRLALTLVGLIGAIGIGLFLVLPHDTEQPPDGTQPIRVAFDTWLGYSSFFLAKELGFYEERGLAVEVTIINPLQEKNAAMARGDLDIMGGSFDSAVISSNAGVPGAIIYVFEKSLGNDALVVDDEIASAGDLRNRRIAVEVGYVSHLFLLNFLDQSGLKVGDVEIVPLSPEDGVAAFLSGNVQAVALYEPFLSRALAKPSAKTLITSRSMDPLFCGTAYASKRMLDEQPDRLKSFVQALQEANDYWRNNPLEGNELVAKFWDLPKEEVEAITINTELFSMEDQERFFGDEESEGLLPGYVRQVAQLWAQVGVVPSNYPTEDLVDPRFARALFSEQR